MAKYVIGKSICYDSVDECLEENSLAYPKKVLTKERIKKIIEHANNKHGQLLLDGELSEKGKCYLKCSEGHIWAAYPNNLTRSKNPSWCPHKSCTALRILSTRDGTDPVQQIKDLLIKNHLSWVSGTYINQRRKNLKLKCNVCKTEDIYSKNQLELDRIKCPYCRKKADYDEVFDLMYSRGMQLITPPPLPNKKDTIEYKCLLCGEKSKPVFDSVMTSIKNKATDGCGKCDGWYKSDSDFVRAGEPYVSSMKGKILEVLWQSKGSERYKVLSISCNKSGHEPFIRTISQLKKGNWCGSCSRPGQKELISKAIFEHLLGAEFKKITPKEGMLLIKEKLELDGYCEKYKLAFEHQGLQHYEFIPHFHKDLKGFKKRQEADKKKRLACKKAGVILIEVNDKYKPEQLETEIRKLLKINVPHMQLNEEKLDLDSINYGRTHERDLFLEEAKDIARKRGGVCLSSEYINSNLLLEFKCSNIEHPPWKACYSSVVGSGTWCPKCGNEIVGLKNRINASEVLRLCEEANVIKLDSEIKEKGTIKYEVKYKKCGHIDFVSVQQLKVKRSCNKCPNPKKGATQRLDLELFRKYAIDKGGKLLSLYYVNSKKKLLFKCKKGHIWPAYVNNIRSKNSWCPACNGRTLKKVDVDEFLREEKAEYLRVLGTMS